MMKKWKDIKIEGIKIKKCVAEFEIWEQQYSPYGKFIIKIRENDHGEFNGYSNLLVKDTTGEFYCAVGHGSTVEDTLEDTIRHFYEMTSRKLPKEWVESDFERADSFDF